MITKEKLEKLYNKGLSMMEIAVKTGCSNSGVRYLAEKYNIPRRSRSEANYLKYNPVGNPFKIKKLKTKKDLELFNLGIGLFLGEGTKKNKYNVALANSDPGIIKLFLVFIRQICGVKDFKIKAALNIFDDMNLNEALNFWQKETGIPHLRFATSIIRKSKGGTYKNKSKYGTLTVYVSNMKLKALMDEWCQDALTHYS
jgi:hypothetical protein